MRLVALPGPRENCMRVVTLTATPEEAGPIARALHLVRIASISGFPTWATPAASSSRSSRCSLTLLAGGMGPAAAARASRAVLRHAGTVDLLLIAGVAGALSPALNTHDVLVADRVHLESGEVLNPSGGPAAAPLLTAGAGRGRFLSLDRVLTTPEEKAEAFRSLRATAEGRDPDLPVLAEMETGGAAGVALEMGVPWAAVRIVLDTADESLPLDFNPLIGSSGLLGKGRLMGAILRRPAAIPSLIRLGMRTGRAAAHLGAFLAEAMVSLTEAQPQSRSKPASV